MHVPTDTNAEGVLASLQGGELEVEGQLVSASNIVLRVWVHTGAGEEPIPAVYKPIRGERPLRDFPSGTLAAREWAAYEVSVAGGWDVIPPTVLRDGPFGPGSVQAWVGPLEPDPDDHPDVLHVGPPGSLPPGHRRIVEAQGEFGSDLVVSHVDNDQVRSIALLDVVLNNADRKASALIADEDRLWAIDHGLCLHDEDKLRTVLWGFAGDDVCPADAERLDRLDAALDGGLGTRLREALSAREVTALHHRVARTRQTRRMPPVPMGRYPLPWPLW